MLGIHIYINSRPLLSYDAMTRDTVMRRNLWEPLRSDDHVALIRALLCHGFASATDLHSLRWRMWRGGAGKGGARATSLLCVAATNVVGVPAAGAVGCMVHAWHIMVHACICMARICMPACTWRCIASTTRASTCGK